MAGGEACITCGVALPEDARFRESDWMRGQDDRWYTNGWLGHPELTWYVCPACYEGGRMGEAWGKARAQVTESLERDRAG